MLDIIKCERILCRLLLLKDMWRPHNIYKPKFCCVPRPQSPDIWCFFNLVHATGALYDATECFFFFIIINNISDAHVSIRPKRSPGRDGQKQSSNDTQIKFPFTILTLVNVFFFFFFLDDLLNVHSSALLWLYNIGLCNTQLQPSPGDTHTKSKTVNKYSDILY